MPFGGILFILFGTLSASISSSSSLPSQGNNDCQWIPSSISTSISNLSLFQLSNDCLLRSSLVVQEKTSIPHLQGWSHCRDCGFMKGTLKPNSDSGPEAVDLTWSQWSSSFLQNFTQNNKARAGSILISTPIFIIPLICLHPGHVLVDLMEQVYWSMLEIYGEVRLDSMLVLDVSNMSEEKELAQAIDSLVNTLDGSSYGYMIHWLTHRSVVAYEDFVSLMNTIPTEMIIFSDIHFGGDISSTLMHLGTPHNPCQFQLQDRSLNSFFQSYQQFHKFISDRVNEMIKDQVNHHSIIDVLFISRNSSRNIVNMKEMIDVVSAMNLTWLIVDFAVTPFKTQLIYLRKTRLLVAAAGTAVHNMVFMNHSTSAIVVMMADWCHCSWQYANQGILVGINVLTYCQPDETENQVSVAHSTFNFWSQCSIVPKFSDMFVDIRRFTSDLHKIFDSTQHDKLSLHVSWCNIGRSFVDNDRQNFPLPKFMFTDLISTKVKWSGFWSLSLIEELYYSKIPQNMFRSFTHLSVCHIFHLGAGVKPSVPACFLIDSQNYHAAHEIQTSDPTLTIHSYGQISPDGGKILNSDNFMTIDLRVRDVFSRALPMIELRLGNESDCLDSKFDHIICSARESKIELCIGKITPGLSFEISLQSIVKTLCQSFFNDISSCPILSSSLSHCIHNRVLETQLALPHPQYQPTPEKPFVFLHIEKTAGTSIRRFLHLSSSEKSLTSLIPGYGDLHPTIFDLRDFDGNYLKDVSVLAGHFSWDIWDQLPSTIPKSTSFKTSPPPCFVMGRHPADRVLSYFYQRCYRESHCPFSGIPFNNLTSTDLMWFMTTFRQGLPNQRGEYVVVDEGVQDAACRALSNRKQTTGRSIYDISNVSDTLAEWEEELALKHIESCVVGLQENWINTKKAINHWFPWINTELKEEYLMKVTNRKESIDMIRPDLLKIIEETNRCDLKLYEKMKSLFAKQLSVIENDAYLV